MSQELSQGLSNKDFENDNEFNQNERSLSDDEVPTFEQDQQEDDDYDNIMKMIMQQNKELGGQIEDEAASNRSPSDSSGENKVPGDNLADELGQMDQHGSNNLTNNDFMMYQDTNENEYGEYKGSQNTNSYANQYAQNAQTASQYYQDSVAASQRSYKSGVHDSQGITYQDQPYSSGRNNRFSDEYADKPISNYNELSQPRTGSNPDNIEGSDHSPNESPPKMSGPAIFEKQSHISTRQMVSKVSEDFQEMLPDVENDSNQKRNSQRLNDIIQEEQYQSQSEQYQSLKRHIFGRKQIIQNEKSSNLENNLHAQQFIIKNEENDCGEEDAAAQPDVKSKGASDEQQEEDGALQHTLEQIQQLTNTNGTKGSQQWKQTSDYATQEVQNRQMTVQLQMLKTQLLLARQIIEKESHLKLKLILKVKELQKENILLNQDLLEQQQRRLQLVDFGTQFSVETESKEVQIEAETSEVLSELPEKEYCEKYTQTIPQVLVNERFEMQSFQRPSISSRPSILSARPFLRSSTQKEHGSKNKLAESQRRYSLIRGHHLAPPKLYNFENDIAITRNSCLTARQGYQSFFQLKKTQISNKIEKLKEIQYNRLNSPRLGGKGSFKRLRTQNEGAIVYDEFRTLKTVKPEELMRLSLMHQDWKSQISEENSVVSSPVKRKEAVVADALNMNVWSKMDLKLTKKKNSYPLKQKLGNKLETKQEKKRRNSFDGCCYLPAYKLSSPNKRRDRGSLRKPIIQVERESSNSFSSQLRDDLKTSSEVKSEKISTNSEEDCPFQQINETVPSYREEDEIAPKPQQSSKDHQTRQTEVEDSEQIVQIENSPIRVPAEENKEQNQIQQIQIQESDKIPVKKVARRDPGSPNSGFLNINIKKTPLTSQLSPKVFNYNHNLSKTQNLTELGKYSTHNHIQMHDPSQLFWKTKFEELLNEKKRQMRQIHNLNQNIQSQESQLVQLRSEMKSAIEAKEETIEELMKEIVRFRVQIEELSRDARQNQIREIQKLEEQDNSESLQLEQEIEQLEPKFMPEPVSYSQIKPRPAAGSLEAAIKTITDSISARILKTHLEQQKVHMIRTKPKKIVSKTSNPTHISRQSIGSPKKIKKYITKKDDKVSKPKSNLKVQVLRASHISGESLKQGNKVSKARKSKPKKQLTEDEVYQEISQSFDQIEIENLDESLIQAQLSAGDIDEQKYNETKQPIMVFKEKKSPSMKRSPSFAESGFASGSEDINRSKPGGVYKQRSMPNDNKISNNIFKTPSKTSNPSKEGKTILQLHNNYFVQLKNPKASTTIKTKSPGKKDIKNMTSIKSIIHNIKQQNQAQMNAKYPPIRYSKVPNEAIDSHRSKSGKLKLKVKKKTSSTINPSSQTIKSKYDPFIKASQANQMKKENRLREMHQQIPHVLSQDVYKQNDLNMRLDEQYGQNLNQFRSEFESNQQQSVSLNSNQVDISPSKQNWQQQEISDQQYRQRIQDEIISSDEVYEWDDDQQMNWKQSMESVEENKQVPEGTQNMYKIIKDQMYSGNNLQGTASLRNQMHNGQYNQTAPHTALLPPAYKMLRSAREPDIQNQNFVVNIQAHLQNQEPLRLQEKKQMSHTNSPFKATHNKDQKLRILKSSKTIDANKSSRSLNPKKSVHDSYYASNKSLHSKTSQKIKKKSKSSKSNKTGAMDRTMSPSSSSRQYGPQIVINNTIENKFAQFLKVHVKQDDGSPIDLGSQQITIKEDL